MNFVALDGKLTNCTLEKPISLKKVPKRTFGKFGVIVVMTVLPDHQNNTNSLPPFGMSTVTNHF